MNCDAYLSLVRLGIGNAETVTLPDRIDWDEVEALAKQHGLMAVVYDGVNRLVDSAENVKILPLTTKLRWIGEVMQGYEQRYVLYRKAVADLAAWYHAHGYRMMLLKGLACGMNWPKPEHRPYGDIDIYLFGKQKEADEALDEWFKSSNVQGFKIDRSHHHHTVFQWQEFTVENHYDVVNVHVYRSSRELESIFKELANTDCTDHTDFCLPSANLHALFLVRHMVSHFTGSNITLRQVLDWGLFVKAHHEEVDWPWLVGVLDKYHMREFFDCINAICVENLGFDIALFPYIQFTTISKERILNDTLAPEFDEEMPKHFWRRVPFKYHRWKSNGWKREMCYNESSRSAFWCGVKSHIMKPASI